MPLGIGILGLLSTLPRLMTGYQSIRLGCATKESDEMFVLMMLTTRARKLRSDEREN